MNSRVRVNHKIPAAFTLIEIIVSVAVLLLLVVLFGQMVNRATAITRVDSRHVDTDSQARAVLDKIAADIGRMIYSSTTNIGRDGAGPVLRFTMPTVAGGRVYIGMRSAVYVYGLLKR